ncbi:MAG: hypothetical protein ACJ751_03425 [Niastella sp.]|uniref:hypothetical protein n=1 Tax=Niastella sp. TaxID=1869183 RepID=UPI00389A5B84
MKKFSIISALALSALVYSCKKDNDSKTEEPMKKPADLIVGHWGWVVAKEYVTRWTGVHEDTTYRYFGAQDSMIFEPNGRVITRVLSRNYIDTSSYRFIADSTLIMWDDTVKLSVITANNLTIYSKDTIFGNSGGLRGNWSVLKK